jgi:hypothetical protein
MDTIAKAEIIAEWYQTNQFELDDNIIEFRVINDIGIPLAYLYVNDFCDVYGDGINAIENTYDELCKFLGRPNNKEYKDLKDLMGE